MRVASRLTPLLFSLAVLGCSDDTTVADSASTESESSSTDSGPMTVGTSGATSDESESGAETETGEPEPYCGDGNLDILEECDDGNQEDGDGCSSECKSACGISHWIDINTDAGWFDVQAMVASDGGSVVLAGDVETEGQPGYLHVTTLLEDQIQGAMDSPPLGSAGTMDLPQTHQIDALALTATGDVLAIGTSTEVLVVDEAPVVSYWLARYAAGDLSEQWRVDIPSADPDLRPRDVAALEGGDALITMTVEIAPNDTDIGVERRAGNDGSLVWTNTVSGELEGGWSLDTAGLVAVGAGDRLWAAGIIRVDWQTFETNVIELDPANGSMLWSGVPLPDPGNAHEQRVWDLAAGPGGQVAVGISVLGPASPYHYGGAYSYVEHELIWSLIPDDLPWEDGGPYIQPRVAIDDDGEVLVSGTYTHDFEIATAARPWVVAMALDGAQLCGARVGEGTDAGVIPKVGFFDGGRGALNIDTYGPGGMGPGSDGNWIAVLRGW